MQIEECFLEMICHSRWVFNYCLTRLDPRVAEEYSADLVEFRAALEALSVPRANVDDIVDVPSVAVASLCKGVCYLLLGEEVLGGNAPTTMHQFLRQTKETRQDSAKQAHIITIRWFVNAGLLHIDDLLQVIYGESVQVSDYASDYEAQMAVAEALCVNEPFYLGAHVTLLRALLLQYCSTIITADDVVSHVLKVDPNATAELYTLEDTLLFWLKSILQLSPSDVCDSLSSNLTDIYLHTNDGRVLSLIVHYYQPAALQLNGIALDGDSLTIQQRQDNWSRIISAAESMGLWVGVFASEIVTHGFATLQLHILRIVEELFAVLAVGIENSYKEILENIGLSRENRGVDSCSRASSILQQSVRNSMSYQPKSTQPSLSTSAVGVVNANHHDENDYPQADTTIVNQTILTSVCSPELDHSTAMVGYDPNRSAFTSPDRMVVANDDEEFSAHISAMMSGSYSPVPHHHTVSDVDMLGANRGQSSSLRRDIVGASQRSITVGSRGTAPSTVQSLDRGTDAHRTNVTDSASSTGGGDYNIILTNMFLQGVAVPVHRAPTTSPPTDRSTTNSPPAYALGTLGSIKLLEQGGNSPQSQTEKALRFDDTQELSAYVRTSATSSHLGRAREDEQPTTPRNQRKDPILDGPEYGDSPAPISHVGDSPVRSSRNRQSSTNVVSFGPPVSTESPTRLSSNSRYLTVPNQEGNRVSSSLTASLAQLHKGRVSRSSANALTHSLHRPRVQGSIDGDGIGDLIAELKALSRQPIPTPPTTAQGTPEDLVSQNKGLRAALQHQQQIVAAFIKQFQRGLQNQKQFEAISSHLASSMAIEKPPQRSEMVSQSFVGSGKKAPLSLTQQLAQASPGPLVFPSPSVDEAFSNDDKPLTHGRKAPGVLVKQSYNRLPPGLNINLLKTQHQRETGSLNSLESVDNPTPLPALKRNPVALKAPTSGSRLAPPPPTAFDVSVDNLRANKGAAKPPAHILERLEAGAPVHGVVQRQARVRATRGAVIKISEHECSTEEDRLPPIQNGPEPAVRIWNNKSSISLAFRHALLPGAVNKPTLEAVLGTMEDCIANNDGTGIQQQFVVLLKDEFAHIFRGLYVLRPNGQLSRIFGSGPLEAYVGPDPTSGGKNQPKSPWTPHLQRLAATTASLHPRFFKFDTSNKKFLPMPHTEANNTTDAITFSKVSKIARERW